MLLECRDALDRKTQYRVLQKQDDGLFHQTSPGLPER